MYDEIYISLVSRDIGIFVPIVFGGIWFVGHD
jgi:hypothetical protein